MRDFRTTGGTAGIGISSALLLVVVFSFALLSAGCAGVTVSKPPAGNTGPIVSITSPSSGATESGTVNVTATATDSDPVTSVQFQVDGANLGAADTVAPYTQSLNTKTLTNGKHSLTAIATDSSGNRATSAAVSITVSNTSTTPLSVSITSPANGATESGTVNVTATATDGDPVTSVQFQVDGGNLGAADTVAPYTQSLNTKTLTNGKHSLTAIATDSSGNRATSAAVSITVSNTSTTPLSVSITSPANGATESGTVNVTATATDGDPVTSVQFQVDGANLGAADTVAPYTQSLNTKTLTNGKHSLTAIATDSSGNRATSAAVSITVSNTSTTPLSVSITSPANGATESGAITVAATATDSVAITSVQFQVDGGNLGAADTVAPYTQTLSTTTLTNGKHSLTAIATDSSGNRATSAAVSITVSNTSTTPLSVSITSPANGATESGTITVAATATDSVAITSVQFQVDGGNLGAADTVAPYTQTLSTTTLTNGKHSLTAIATDSSGNRATSAAVSITVSNTSTTPLSVSITSPANGATESGTITVAATATDSVAITSVQFQVDGGNLGAADTVAPYTQTLSTTTLTNGKHSLTAIATDSSGNRATSAAVSITVSNTSTTPLSVSITSPANGATESGTITVAATATDSVAITSVQFQVDGGNLGAADTVAPYTQTLSTTTLTNGKHSLTAIATDSSGNRATSAAVSITVSNTSTTPLSVSITSPANGATESGTITVAATATDSVAITSVQFQVDGGNLGAADTVAPYTQTLSTTTLTNGKHSLTAIATDSSGNRATSAAVSITVSNTSTTPLSVSITSPANGATESGTITVAATATDSVAITSVQFQVDGGNLGAADTVAPYTQTLSTTTLTNGKHSLTAIATDSSGNRATSAAVSITVSNTSTTPLSVSITSPANGATESGTITVAATATDSVAITSVQFQVDGGNLGAADTVAPYTQTLSTTTLTNGKHSLTAIATDSSGNRATSAAVSITVSNTSTTPLSVSITSPANGATVSGTVTVSATATDSLTVVSVQFLLDGADLGSKVTSAPYSVQWNTTSASSGAHTLMAQAVDTAGNSATSGPVSVTISQSSPPPPPVGDEITISDTTGLGQTNRPVSIARPFVQGEIANFAQASINGTSLLTQCDVKNRWPDGSLKFAIVSFVIPNIGANGSVVVSFSNQTTGNNTGFLAKSDMLAAGYNFDGQIQLSGAASQNISARAILNAAPSCASPTNDPDGTIGTNLCTYWLQGPIVTAVILEDRDNRSFDVNTDGGSGNPLHPRFEAWFYPATNEVQLGYTLEDIWASTTPTSSARDQVINGIVLTGGNTNPVREFSNTGFTMITRSMLHKTYCVNGRNAGSEFDCVGSTVHIDHSWPYLATTKALPHYDPSMTMLPSAIASEYSGLFSNTSALALQGCTGCVGGGSGVGYYPTAFDATGASAFHGINPTWDVEYLMTQCDAGNSTSSTCGNGSGGDLRSVMLTIADLAGRVPYWFREADTNAGHGQTFDNSGIPGNVQTLGRVVSINARTQISLFDVTASQNQCNNNYAADWINYGGSGQDLAGWDTDTGHWPNIAYASYLSTGQYHYYETQLMQTANALGNSPGTRACTQPTQNGTLRMGSLGYWYLGDERGTNWTKRENLYGAFLAVDGSPEQAYFLDKLDANLAIEEALHGVPNDIGSNYTSAYAFGQANRCNGIGYCPATLYGPLGVWNAYSPAYSQDGQPPAGNTFYSSGGSNPVPQSADANFQAAFSAAMVGVAYDLGFTSNALLQYVTKRYTHLTQDPTANIYTLANYVFPTTDANGNWFTSYSAMVPYYASYPTNWPGIGGGTCQGGDEPYDLEGLAAFSYGATYNFTDAGYSASSGWNAMRSQLQPCWSDTTQGYGFPFDPKWDITPRTSTSTSPPPPPTVAIISPASGTTESGTITTSATASSSVGIATVQFSVDGANVGAPVNIAPYSQSVNTTNLTNGQHQLTATAINTANEQATSAPVTIMVSNSASTTPPTVPNGLTATAVSSSVINLSWTPSTDGLGVSGYYVFRNGTQVGTIAGTTYQDTGLSASTTYSYTVEAYDPAGNVSAQSSPASVTTPSGSSPGNPLSTAPGWHKISYSELQGPENTSPCPPNNYGGYGYNFYANCPAVFIAWSSAIADTSRHRLVFWGGGHTDYSGNEVYALDLTKVGSCSSAQPCLYRLDNPSPPNASGSADTGSDGLPVSRHSYQGLVYIPTTDVMLSVGGSPAPGGQGDQNTWTLDMSSVVASCAPNCTPTWKHVGSMTSGSGPGEGTMVAWDSGNSIVQLLDDQYNLEKYSTTAGAWTNETTSLLVSGYNGNTVYDSHDQLIFHMGCYTTCDAFWVSTASGSSYTQNNITLAGSCGSIEGAFPTMAWDPVGMVIRFIPNGSNMQYLLKPSTTSSTWSCTTETYGSTQGVDYPPAQNASLQGINGKFNYFADWDVYVYCNDPTGDCWYFKPNR